MANEGSAINITFITSPLRLRKWLKGDMESILVTKDREKGCELSCLVQDTALLPIPTPNVDRCNESTQE